MLIHCDFDYDAWIKGLVIEANSKEDALKKLYSMSIEDIIASGGYIQDYQIRDVDLEIEEATYKIVATDITYIKDEDAEGKEEDLPSEMILEIVSSARDLDWYAVEDAINDELTWHTVDDFDYEILEMH